MKLLKAFVEAKLHVILSWPIKALKKLTESHSLASCRFWGKIQGTQSNYIVAQTTFREGADEVEDDDENNEEEEEEANEGKFQFKTSLGFHDVIIWQNVNFDLGEEEDKEDALPVSSWKPPMVIPPEERGAGANKYVFFVCNRVSCWRHQLIVMLYF